MQGVHYADGERSSCPVYPSNYIYCTVCDSLVFISDNWKFCLTHSAAASNHLKRCIAGNTRYGSISAPVFDAGECAKREEFLHMIAQKEYSIWQAKQKILRHEAEIKRIQLELLPQSQSFSHSEKDKLASATYDYNLISFDYYRASMAGLTQHDYTTMAGPSSAQHDYTNLGTLSVYFKSMQKGANL